MERMGPEALMVMWRIPARTELSEFVQTEYGRSEARAAEARIRTELENLPVERTGLRRWLHWAVRRLGRGGDPARPTTMARSLARAVPAGAGGRSQLPRGVPLAALPAARAADRREGPAIPISVAPVLGEACRPGAH
jgi:hypothetical protein